MDGHSPRCRARQAQVLVRERAEKHSTPSSHRPLAYHLRLSRPQTESVARVALQTTMYSPAQLVQSAYPLPSQPSPTMFASLGLARYSHAPNGEKGIILISSKPVFCEIRQVNEVFDYFVSDTIQALAVIGTGLNCVLHFHRTAQLGHVLLWATSSMADGKTADHGSAFLQGVSCNNLLFSGYI